MIEQLFVRVALPDRADWLGLAPPGLSVAGRSVQTDKQSWRGFSEWLG